MMACYTFNLNTLQKKPSQFCCLHFSQSSDSVARQESSAYYAWFALLARSKKIFTEREKISNKLLCGLYATFLKHHRVSYYFLPVFSLKNFRIGSQQFNNYSRMLILYKKGTYELVYKKRSAKNKINCRPKSCAYVFAYAYKEVHSISMASK